MLSPRQCLASLSSTAGSLRVVSLWCMACVTLRRLDKASILCCVPPRVAPRVLFWSVGVLSVAFCWTSVKFQVFFVLLD